ncbi:hypothetical protein OH77DRAFT_1428707 [Trametes cingulata]|nr:hypothetical protein OH77DRAFT_1428707 [Trametes cingulata]
MTHKTNAESPGLNGDQHPFTDPSADVIFCSSDNVHFRLHKIILSLSSDFFRDMLSLSQPSLPSAHTEHAGNGSATSDTEVDEIPVVRVTETAGTLEPLFQLIYPIKDLVLESVDDVRLVLEAALKYQIRKIIEVARRRLLELAPIAPLRVYAIACRYSDALEDVIGVAATQVLRQEVQHTYVEELEDISVGAYHRLLYYCECGGDVPPGFAFHRAPAEPAERDTVEDTEDIASSAWKDEEQPDGDQGASLGLFKPDESSEVIVQTSDRVHLGVPRNILQLSSPVLSARLATLPADTSGVLLEVAETSRAMRILLEIYHPACDAPLPTGAPQIVAAVMAAEKLQMKKAVSLLRCALKDLLQKLLSHATVMMDVDSLLELYLAACCFEWQDLACAVARRSLGLDITKSPIRGIDLYRVSGGCLFRLLDYHRRCREATRGVVTITSLERIAMQWLLGQWKCLDTYCDSTPPCWMQLYLKVVSEFPRPTSAWAMGEGTLNRIAEGSLCSLCSTPKVGLILAKFSKHVAGVLDARVDEVVLDWKSAGLR